MVATQGFYVLDPTRFESSLKGDFDWAKANVPFIDVPELPDIQTAYYYRWTSYKKHLQSTPDGWVVTEFLPDVAWAGKYNTIPAAAGHHIMEGRWIHNASYLEDYITFWFRRGGLPRSYTSWFAWAVWQHHMVSHNTSFTMDVFPDLLDNLREWTRTHRGDYGGGRICYWQQDGYDAMEVSISGSGCRPTIESVMYGEAVALLEMAKLAGNTSIVDELEQVREQARRVVLEQMWNPGISSFAVIPLGPPPPAGVPVPQGFEIVSHGRFCCDQSPCRAGHSSFLFEGALGLEDCVAKCRVFGERCQFVTWSRQASGYCQVAEFCNSTNPWAESPEYVTTYARQVPHDAHGQANCPGDGRKPWTRNVTVSVRELLGFMPWYFSLPTAELGQLIPQASLRKYEVMWRQLFDLQGFAAKWGLRTAELRSPCYNYSYAHRDCWNGPSWPYETARVLTAASNVLNDYPMQSALTKTEYLDLLDQYAKQHTQTYARNDTADPIRSGHIFEVLHPDDGYWINRQAGNNDGTDYNHSTFIDLILSGLFGIRPRHDSVFVLSPLVPLTVLTHFAVDHVLYHGRYISVVWDVDGSHYGRGIGFKLFVDGEIVAQSKTLQRLNVDLAAVLYV